MGFMLRKTIVIFTVMLGLCVTTVVSAQEEAGEGEGEGLELQEPQLNPNSSALPIHQVSGGFGMPLCGVVNAGNTSGGSCFIGEGFFANIPIMYRRRVNERIAFGGGLMITIFAIEGFGFTGAELLGNFRVYAIPDYLYFDVNVFMGFPLIFGLAPGIGHAFAINEKINIYIENQFLMMLVGGFFGVWQPVIGMEFKF